MISQLESVLHAELLHWQSRLASRHVQVSCHVRFIFLLVECCHSTSILVECCHFFLLNAVIQVRLGHFVSEGLYNVQFDHGPRFPICHTTKPARSWEKLSNVSQCTSCGAFCAVASLCDVHLRMLDGPYPGVHQGML